MLPKGGEGCGIGQKKINKAFGINPFKLLNKLILVAGAMLSKK